MIWKKFKWPVFVIAVFLLAFLGRLVFSFGQGNFDDSILYQIWSFIGTTKGVTSLYDTIPNLSFFPANYPPLILYLLTFVGLIYKSFFSLNFVFNTPILFFLLKLFPILFDIALGLILYFFVSSNFSKKAGFIASAFLLFNPAIFFNSAVWGQTDSILMFFLAVSMVFLIKGKFNYAWFFYALSFFTKQQALIFFPLMIFLTFKLGGNKRLYKALITGIATSFIVIFPFIASGKFLNFLERMFYSLTQYPVLSKNAFNFWWFLFGEKATFLSDQKSIFWFYNPHLIGAIFFILVYFYVFQKIKKSQLNPHLIILAFLTIAFAFFIFPTEIHERYLLYSIPFSLLLLFYDKRVKLLFFSLSALAFLNLTYSFPLFYPSFSLPFLTQFLSLVNISMFGYLFYLYSPLKRKRARNDN